MSSAWMSVSLKLWIRSFFGSSELRMTLITFSMLRKAIMRPSRIWTRSATSVARCLRAPLEHLEAELRPLADRPSARPICRGRPSVAIATRFIASVAFHGGVGQEEGHQLVDLDLAGARLEHDAHRVLGIGIVALALEEREGGGLEALLVGREGLLAGFRLRIHQLVDLGQHLRRRRAGRKLGHRDAILPARELLHVPPRANADAAAPRLVERA